MIEELQEQLRIRDTLMPAREGEYAAGLRNS